MIRRVTSEAACDAQGDRPDLGTLIESATRIIAPSWPLDRQIAVNPLWGLIDQPFDEAARRLHRLTGTSGFVPPPDIIESACGEGRVTAETLKRAMADRGTSVSIDSAIATLGSTDSPPTGLPLPSDVLDGHGARRRQPRWRDTITQQVSQHCAAYFDMHQADWHGSREEGLFESWRDALLADHSIEPLMRTASIRQAAVGLPAAAEDAIAWALDRLDLSPPDSILLMQTCLLRINGWASWCAWLGWQAKLAGHAEGHLKQLLAIRLCWEALLLDEGQTRTSIWYRWQQRWHQARDVAVSVNHGHRLTWQRALEIAYQDSLVRQLTLARDSNESPDDPVRPTAQLIFCIDVRSERIRRAVESLEPGIQTLGFAGFFGLPLSYRPLGSRHARAQLPGLLSPQLEATESSGDRRSDLALASRTAARDAMRSALRPFLKSPSGGFTLVETLGLGFTAALLRNHFAIGPRKPETGPALRLVASQHEDLTMKSELVASILRAMSLTKNFAPLLVLVGHGSETTNNPQAAALDCGACGGHSGEVNARVLAGLLNDAAVRNALSQHEIHIPADTLAVAALHNTTTDEVVLYDRELVPDTHREALAGLEARLRDAGHSVRRERAPTLGLKHVDVRPGQLLKSLKQRARDWAETRPEWGLANNASLIIAPRKRTRGIDLEGRSFLHDYDWREDDSGRVLELIMTAPMIVAHWINLQYYASTVDPDLFGSGNKVLHNVACGRIGVFEGNTGDLRIGLSRQSLHDGTRWMHEPVRLSVFIDAPRERIEAIMAKHETVSRLVRNQWLHLFRFGEDKIERYRSERWQPWTLGVSP